MSQEQNSSPLPTVKLKYAKYSPFIYRKMIGQVDRNIADGDLVAVVDKNGRTFGCGFYNSRSQIALRMVHFGQELLDESFIDRRIAQAVQLRRDVLKLDETTDAYRIIHAEGDQLSGLIADRFGDYIVIELFSLAMFRRIDRIQDALIDAGMRVKEFIVRTDAEIARQEGIKLGKLAKSEAAGTIITENGIQFEVNLEKGHKTGFFCDQRENRKAFASLTAGRSVLDMCCYSAGFSCYAEKLGNAAAVTAVDIDEVALASAHRNKKLNRLKFEIKQSDAFEYFRNSQKNGRKWDVIVLDPPKFIPTREEFERGMKKYRDLNFLAAGSLNPGGLLLTCSCSGLVDQQMFVETVSRACRQAGRSAQIFRITAAGPDHPIMSDAPQSGYLKAVWARLD